MKTFIALLALAAVAVAAPSGTLVQLVVNINANQPAADGVLPDTVETPVDDAPSQIIDPMPVIPDIIVPVMPGIDVPVQVIDVMPVVNPAPAAPPAIELPAPVLPGVNPPVVPDAAINLPEILN